MRVTWAVTPFDLKSQIYYKQIMCGSVKDGDWQEIKLDMKYFKHGKFYSQFQYVYTAVIQGLSPECTYEYQVGNWIFWRNSRFFSGRTPYYNQPFDKGDLEYQPTVIVLGDMGIGNFSQYTRQMLEFEAQKGNYDFSIHLGDIAYDLDNLGGEVGNIYMKDIESFASEYPYMTVPGNHEHYRNFTDYINRFYMPKNWASQNTSLYYSFNFGRAHFINFNTEAIFYNSKDVQDRLYKWLKEDLEQANKNRDEVPWIITSAHKPFYCSIDYRYSDEEKYLSTNDNCLGQTIETKNAYEELFFINKVDLILAGHVHKYERNSAIYKEMPMPCDLDLQDHLYNCEAPVHIITGNAGNDHLFEPISKTPQEWYRSGADDATGYGKLYVMNETHIYWVHYDSKSGKTTDNLWLSKDRTTYSISLEV